MDFLCFLRRYPILLVQNQHRSAADLLLHETIGRAFLLSVQTEQVCSVDDRNQTFQFDLGVQRGLRYIVDNINRVRRTRCFNHNDIRRVSLD
ncbi:hypothetical protein D3C73_1421290 [compost metagenome]